MTTRQESFYIQGSDLPLPERIALRAGPLSAIYEDGALRNIRLGQQDVLLKIYAAVRDHNWGTIPAQITNLRITTRSDSFTITFHAHHNQGPVDFSWQGSIQGLPDGTIEFDFDGQAASSFRRNRIGFCVLHPHTCAGTTGLFEHSQGPAEPGQFPTFIAPHQPFLDLTAITHTVRPGVSARVSFFGDIFEMEDQRNWTDASFKTYCTPLALPYPVTVSAGMRVQQTVKLEINGSMLPAELTSGEPVRIHFGTQPLPLPEIGLRLQPAADAVPPAFSTVESQRLRSLNLAHLRLDLHPGQPQGIPALEQAARAALALGVPLEAALHLEHSSPEHGLQAAAQWASRSPSAQALARWLIFRQGELTTSAETMRAARKHLTPTGCPIGGGTDAFFTQLNRQRPPVEALDFAAYSLNPQVHAFDHATLVENLAGQTETVASARAFCGNLPLHVGPVSLKMRWNPDATGPAPITPAGALPPQVDPRQMSLFCAGWTLGSIKAQAEAPGSGAVQSLTYYSILGWEGILESAQGSPLPELFPSIPGAVFPVYHVFTALADFRGGQIIPTSSSSPHQVESLLLARGPHRRLLLANYTADPVDPHLPHLSHVVKQRQLDASTVIQAACEPEAFHQKSGESLAAAPAGLGLSLPQFSLTLLDWDE